MRRPAPQKEDREQPLRPARLHGVATRRARSGPSTTPLSRYGLTVSELRVAEVVAEGLTNREVGERLYLSRHTVDFHLRQIYRKLGVSSRVALTRFVVHAEDSAASGTRPHTDAIADREPHRTEFL